MPDRECILSAFDSPVAKLTAFEEKLKGQWVVMAVEPALHFALLTLFHYSFH